MREQHITSAGSDGKALEAGRRGIMQWMREGVDARGRHKGENNPSTRSRRHGKKHATTFERKG
jgi:hypothetical protein